MSGTFGKSSDRKLIERIAMADKAAVQALFARYHVRIYRFIMRMVGEKSVAERLANEVFLEVWRNAGIFESRSSVGTWLMSIAHRKADIFLTENGRDTLATDDRRSSSSVTADQTKKNRSNSKENILSELIDNMPSGHKVLIDLAYYHEFSVREVSKVLDIPANNVKTRMYHARKLLAGMLKGAGLNRGWP